MNTCFKKRKSSLINLRSSEIETVITFLSIAGIEVELRLLKPSLSKR